MSMLLNVDIGGQLQYYSPCATLAIHLVLLLLFWIEVYYWAGTHWLYEAGWPNLLETSNCLYVLRAVIMSAHAWIMWVLEIEHESLCMHSEHFTSWTVSSALLHFNQLFPWVHKMHTDKNLLHRFTTHDIGYKVLFLLLSKC